MAYRMLSAACALTLASAGAAHAQSRLFTVPHVVSDRAVGSYSVARETILALNSRATRSCDFYVRWRGAPSQGEAPPPSLLTGTYTLAPGRRLVFTTWRNEYAGFSGVAKPVVVPSDAIQGPVGQRFVSGWAEVYSPNCTSSTGITAHAQIGTVESDGDSSDVSVPVTRGP